MATIKEHTNLLFVKQAKYFFESSYPHWKDTFNASPDKQMETICVPDALDVLPNRRLENFWSLATADELAAKRNFVGQHAEDTFFEAFRRLKLGGILICGFDTEEFMKVMNREMVSDFDLVAWKEDRKHFESDAIFLHHQLGAFIIETKGCENGKVKKRLSTAANQLQRRINGMKDIYLQLIGAHCPITYRGVICIPNADINVSQHAYHVIGKAEIESAEFRQYWLTPEGCLDQQLTLNKLSRVPISDEMYTFISAIVGYRSAKFVSMPSNALEIYRIIDQQEFKRDKKHKNSAMDEGSKLQYARSEAIILNKGQLSALECRQQHIIISGPPGTGKTTIMLLRALEAAKLDKPGRIVIVSGIIAGHELELLFQNFFAINKSNQLKREIKVMGNISNVYCDPDNLQDDLFFDEMPVDESILSELIAQPELRWTPSSRVTGTTTIVITGWINPQNIANDIAAALKFFPNFYHIELRTVIRGTLSIVDEWRRFFPEKFIINGHNVKGAPVEHITVNDCYKLVTTVEQITGNLLNANWDILSLNFSFTPKHLAILVSFKKYDFDEQRALISELKRHLIEKNFPCGDIKQQVTNSDMLIAVDKPRNALSFEWPTVIYIRGDNKSDDLIACSRCISKLFIINVAIDAERHPAVHLFPPPSSSQWAT